MIKLLSCSWEEIDNKLLLFVNLNKQTEGRENKRVQVVSDEGVGTDYYQR